MGRFFYICFGFFFKSATGKMEVFEGSFHFPYVHGYISICLGLYSICQGLKNPISTWLKKQSASWEWRLLPFAKVAALRTAKVAALWRLTQVVLIEEQRISNKDNDPSASAPGLQDCTWNWAHMRDGGLACTSYERELRCASFWFQKKSRILFHRGLWPLYC